jgi:hypothetical protein
METVGLPLRCPPSHPPSQLKPSKLAHVQLGRVPVREVVILVLLCGTILILAAAVAVHFVLQ